MTSRTPTVLHVVRDAGAATEGWIEAQVLACRTVRSRLLALGRTAPYAWSQEPDVNLPTRTAGVLSAQLTRFPRTSSRLVHAVLGGLAPVDLVHSHYAHLSVGVAPLVRKLGVPQVLTPYGFDVSRVRYTTGVWERRYARWLPRMAGAIVEGPHMGSRLAELGMPTERIHVVRLPIDHGIVDAAANRPWTDEFAGIVAGRLVPKKGFDLAIRAFARAFPTGPRRLLVVGSGPEERTLRDLARSTGGSDRVVFRSSLPLTEFVAAFRTAAVALFPSRTAPDGDGEGGAPVTLTWAQALGVRAVVSDHDDLPFAAGPDSVVVPQEDVDAIAQVWRELAGATPSTANMEYVQAAYDPDLLRGMREDVYRSILG